MSYMDKAIYLRNHLIFMAVGVVVDVFVSGICWYVYKLNMGYSCSKMEHIVWSNVFFTITYNLNGYFPSPTMFNNI